jgi:hypothetical protein
MVGGWNHPSSRLNLSFTFIGESVEMGGPSTSHISSDIPSSTLSIPMNDFIMANPHLSSSVLYGGGHFYSMGNPLHEVPSSGATFILI